MEYYHELPQSEIDKLISDKKTYQFIMENYKQPDWCKYPEALGGSLGCWSLTGYNSRYKVSKESCKTCDCFKL